jgi:hypothetical protein
MVIAIIIGLYLTRSEPVVYRFVEARVPSDPPIVSIFNPFRDRSPEKCAEAFLELMKVGECEQAMAGLAIDSKYRQYVCEQEIANNLMEWNLKDRNDHPEKVKMRYLVKRHSYTDAKGQLWVIVEKHNSHWQVTNYECWY